jgi:hypothetical protein
MDSLLLDHHLWIRQVIGGRPWLYLPLHVLIVLGLFLALPVTAVIGGLGYLGAVINILLLSVLVYILIFMPIRVCGVTEPAAWISIVLSLGLLNFFL